jgi:hypothetical protein
MLGKRGSTAQLGKFPASITRSDTASFAHNQNLGYPYLEKKVKLLWLIAIRFSR